jgi:hypothetical protein
MKIFVKSKQQLISQGWIDEHKKYGRLIHYEHVMLVGNMLNYLGKIIDVSINHPNKNDYFVATNNDITGTIWHKSILFELNTKLSKILYDV